MTTAEFVKRTAIAVAIVMAPVLIYFLFGVVLIIFGAILIAILLRLIAEPFAQWARFPEPLALLCSVLLMIVVFGGTAYLFGMRMEAEFFDVLSRANAAMSYLAAHLPDTQLGQFMMTHISGGGSFSIPGFIDSLFRVSANLLEAIIITVIAAIYLAAQPALYRAGLTQLFPAERRANVAETLDDISGGLRLWLIGQLIEMLLVGLLSLVAVWFIGLPSPAALGLIAGIAEFVPYLGPIIAAIPALLVATSQSLHAVIWTAIAYLLIHQVEGNLLAPLIQRRMVYIPPAVMLLGIVTVLFAFGTASVIFAAPIVVVLYIAVKKLYIRDSLHEATLIPGENSAGAASDGIATFDR